MPYHPQAEETADRFTNVFARNAGAIKFIANIKGAFVKYVGLYRIGLVN